MGAKSLREINEVKAPHGRAEASDNEILLGASAIAFSDIPVSYTHLTLPTKA